MKKITKRQKQQVIDEMVVKINALALERDVENNHATADDMLCEALLLFEQNELVSAFKALKKWYA